MKKLILSALLTLSVLASFAQTNTTVLRSRVTDSTTVTTVPTDWGAIYYNAQDNKWRVYEDGSWRDLGAGSGGGTITDGSGTTANGTAVDLGGQLTGDASVTGNDFAHGFRFDSVSQFRVRVADDQLESYVGVNPGGVRTGLFFNPQYATSTSLLQLAANYGSTDIGILEFPTAFGMVKLDDSEAHWDPINYGSTFRFYENVAIKIDELSQENAWKGDSLLVWSSDGVVKWRNASSISGGARKDKVITAATYEVTDADNGYYIHLTNASGTEVTIPAGLMDSLTFSTIRDAGAGQVDVVGDGVSLSVAGGSPTHQVEVSAATWFKYGSALYQGFGLLGPTGGGGTGTWGSITGDITDQQDLLNYVAESVDSVEIPDGDRGDFTKSGNTFTIDNLAVTAAKLATLSSADLRGKLTDESGTGADYFQGGDIGTPSAGVLTNATGLPWSTGITGKPTTLSGYGITDAASTYATHNIQTGSNYTLVLSDAQTRSILMRSVSAQTLTIPPVSSVAFPEGTMIIVTQDSTGGLSIVAGSGVVIESSAGNLLSPGQDSPMVLEKKNATNSWFLRNGTAPITSAALTKADDTNVTITLGGSPGTAVLAATSITAGWTGDLAYSRFTQGTARSVLGVTGNATADYAPIQGTANQVLTVNPAGTALTFVSPSGTYTPTLTNTTNVAGSTAYVTGYYRIGTSVTVFGKIDIDPTAAASTDTEIQLTLPVSSNLAAEQDLGGTAVSDVAVVSARIKGDATTDRASIVFKALTTTSDSYAFQFSYQVK